MILLISLSSCIATTTKHIELEIPVRPPLPELTLIDDKLLTCKMNGEYVTGNDIFCFDIHNTRDISKRDTIRQGHEDKLKATLIKCKELLEN